MGWLRRLAVFVALALTTAGLSFVGPVTAGASIVNVTVDQSSLAPGGFWGSPPGSDTGTAGFVSGPATPPVGTGSLALDVPSGQHRSVYDYQYGLCANWPAGYPNCTAPSSTPIASISALAFSTYRDGAMSGPNALPSLNIEIDPNPSGPAPHYTTLVWEQSNNGGSTTDNTWENWDAYNGGGGVFWSSQIIPGFPTAGPGGTLLTWNAIKVANPNAAIKYGLGVNMGTGPAFVGNVDAVTVGLSGNDTVFDFEPSVVNTIVGPGDTSLFPTPTTPWVSSDDNSAAAGDINYVTGPGTPPAGVGSVQIGTATGSGASDLVSLNLANSATRFSQISDMHYSTYRSTVDADNNLAIALQFNVDYDKTDTTTSWQGRVVFEPYQGNSGNITQNTWQTWTPKTAGQWWMSGTPKVGNVSVPQACPQASPCSWNTLLSNYPKAGFNRGQPFVNLKAGSGGNWPGFVGNADDLRISIDGSEANFDFEPNCTTDCYVTTTGSDTNTGSATDPFITIQKAVDTVNSSGTVHVANGTYSAGANITKSLTLDGQSRAGTIIDGANSGTALEVGAFNNVSITHLTVKHFNYGIHTPTGPISNFLVQHVDVVDNVTHGIWSQAFGVTNYTVDDVNASRNNQAGGLAGRGFWMINGVKQNVTVTNSTFDQNGLVGLDISDGSVTGATVSNNIVTNNRDSGIAVLGAIGGAASVVSNNTVTDNGRFGIEIKQSTGDGTDTGVNSVTVSGNTVSRTAAATDARDYAGILVMRRSPSAPAPDQPSGIVIENNSVSGIHRKPSGSTGDGFGIVVGGTGHVITKNTVSGNDVGVQVQGGNVANTQSTIFFDRDDAANGDASVQRNAITGNGVGARIAGNGTADASCNWWGAASGPGGPGGAGTGDGIGTGVGFSSWLTTNNLNGTCAGTATVSVGSASMAEGSGTDPVVNLPVTLSSPVGSTVTVNYATANGTGIHPAIAPNDYTTTSGTVTFLPGQTMKTVPITIRGNAGPTQFDEYDEAFNVVLSSPINATLGTATGTITILNDDTPTVSVSNATINTVEGNAGTHTVPVTVSLSNPSVAAITVGYSTTPGNAVSPSDFLASSGTVTIPAGQTIGTFNVTVKGDTILEDYEYFNVVLSGPGGGASAVPNLGNTTEKIQILNDEKPSLTGTAPTGSEGSTLQFGATLVQRYYQPITVLYTTANGTALAPADYTTTAGSLTFLAGTKGTQTVGVQTSFDFSPEAAETFTMNWSSTSIKVSPVIKTGTIRANNT